MRVLSDWRLRGLLGLVVVAGSLGWMASQSDQHAALSGLAPLSSWFKTSAVSTAENDQTRHMLAGYGELPLHFEANVGQSAPEVKYLAQGGGYSLFLTNTEAVLRLSRGSDEQGRPLATAVLRARLEGANPNPVLSSSEQQSSYSNYFIGNDPRQWRSGVAHYGRVHYGSVWPGIDLVYYGNQRQLEYDFIVQPGANPGLIRMSWHGADNLYVDNEGNLIAETALGPVRQHKPIVFQTINGQRKSVPGRYALNGREVGFALGDYDRSQPLVIDPILVYSSYLGGGAAGLENFSLTGIAVTPQGRAFVTGYTDNTSYPISSDAYQILRKATYNTVVSQLSLNGRNLIYSTYLGGNQSGRASSIAVNADGNAYVAGSTLASDFPTTSGALQTSNTNININTGFVSKLAVDGKSLVYSTYLGGNTKVTGDRVHAIAVNASGQAVVSGETDSSNFPTTAGAYLTTKPGASSSRSGFVSSLNAAGSALEFSSYFGGSGSDIPQALALAAGDVFIGGSSSSSDLPAALNIAGGAKDAFVARFSGDGSSLRYARYVGGSNDEEGLGLAADSTGNVWIAGSSKSANFPVLAAPAGLPGEGSKAEGVDTGFLVRLDNSGAPTYATLLGLKGKATAVALTSSGQPVVVGQMTENFIKVKALSDVSTTEHSNGFIRMLASDGTLAFSTALGGSHPEEVITALALDKGDGIYVAGTTRSINFPLRNPAYDYSGSSGNYGFASKIGIGPEITLTLSPATTGVNMDAVLGWDNTGAPSRCYWDDVGTDVPDPLSGSRTVALPAVGDHDYTLICQNSDGNSSETATIHIVPAPSVSLALSRSSVAINQEVTLTWSSTDAISCAMTVESTPTTGEPRTETINFSTDGSLKFSPATTGTEKYTLSCTGPGAEAAASSNTTLTIVPRPTLVLTATPSGNPITALPGSITYNWTGNGMASCVASGAFSSNGLPGSGSQTVPITSVGKHPGLTLKCLSNTGIELEQKTPDIYAYDATATPVISLVSAAPGIVRYQSVKLTWSVQNATECTRVSSANAHNGNWVGKISGAAELDNGAMTVTPQSVGLHTYTLSCTGPGTPLSKTIEVDVTAPPPASVLAFLASPSTLSLGQNTTLYWQSNYANSCSASGDWSGSLNPSGSMIFKPTHTGVLQLTLTCSGDNGSHSSSGSKTIAMTVSAAAASGDSDTGGGDSGGPVDLLLLTGLGLLGLARRQLKR